MLLYRSHDVQVFAFGRDPRARFPVLLGVEIRWRSWPNGRPVRGASKTSVSPVWTHVKFFVWRTARPDLRRGRGFVIPFEVNTWKTSPRVNRERVTMKAGFRLKVMRGGAWVPETRSRHEPGG